MQANKGDWLVVEAHHVGEGKREGLIIDVPHVDGSPPYRVRWRDGREALVFPGPDGRVVQDPPDEHVASRARGRKKDATARDPRRNRPRSAR